MVAIPTLVQSTAIYLYFIPFQTSLDGCHRNSVAVEGENRCRTPTCIWTLPSFRCCLFDYDLLWLIYYIHSKIQLVIGCSMIIVSVNYISTFNICTGCRGKMCQNALVIVTVRNKESIGCLRNMSEKVKQFLYNAKNSLTVTFCKRLSWKLRQ